MWVTIRKENSLVQNHNQINSRKTQSISNEINFIFHNDIESLENHEFYHGTTNTSPSGEKLRADIEILKGISEPAGSKLGSPGGPVASKTLIFVTLFPKKKKKREKANAFMWSCQLSHHATGNN